jgi:hypothetical protein
METYSGSYSLLPLEPQLVCLYPSIFASIFFFWLYVTKGLSSCANLKWLSVKENKLVSLKGVEGLSKLQVSHPPKVLNFTTLL